MCLVHSTHKIMDLMNPICCLRKSIGIKCDNNNFNNVGIYANFDFLNV